MFTAANAITPASSKAFSESLRALGWIEGKNVVVERYLADNRLDRLAEIAAELAHLNFDVIVTVGTLAPLAAKRATATIPIVMQAAGDPFGERACSKFGAPRRQRHRVEPDGARSSGKTVGNTQGDCSRDFPRGRPLECGESLSRARL